MIKVHKDYEKVPEALTSKAAERAKETYVRDLYYPVIRGAHEELSALYFQKCAFCEIKLFSIGISHYRPMHSYLWLSLEWSNLLSSCLFCMTHQGDKFPLFDEDKRIREPQKDRREWIANSPSFLAEGALLLNPEIDDPGEFLSFHPDGRIYGQDKRSSVTINTFALNRNDLLTSRKEIVDDFHSTFRESLEKVKNIKSDNPIIQILDLAFEQHFKQLLQRAQPQSEFSLLGQCMIRDFDTFFIEPLEKTEDQDLLRMAYNHFMTKNKDAVIPEIEKSAGLRASANLEKVSIQALKIDNIKCFDTTEFHPSGQSTLILGTNGRGKSTILQLLALGLSELERPPTKNDWFQVVKAGQDNASFEIQLNISGGTLDLDFSIDSSDNIKCTKNAKKLKSLRNGILVLAYGHGRNIGRWDVPPNEKFQDIATLFGNAGYLKDIKESSVYQYVKAGFKEIKELINIILKLADPKHTVSLTDFDTEGFYFKTPSDSTARTSLESMSDGFKSTFVLLFDLIVRAWQRGIDISDSQNTAGIVLIDEIDLHLHPTWQRTILPALLEVFPNIQFIVTTHSPFIVQSMRTDNIILLRAKENGVIAEKLEMKGKPFGWEIEKIIKETIGIENDIPEVSATLFEWLQQFEEAVEKGNQASVTQLYKRIKEVIPQDSGFSQYLDIMSAGLLLDN